MNNHSSKKLLEMSLDELWHLFPISLVEHKDLWNIYYKEMEDFLLLNLTDVRIVRISHIGSTAISNIMAKDIVDILVEIDPLESLTHVASKIEKMGFLKMSSSDKRYAFNFGYTENGFAEKVFHLHLHYQGDNDELYFRDYMNEHPASAKQYESLKLALWKKYEYNRDAYTDAKANFVKKYTDLAKEKYPNRYQ